MKKKYLVWVILGSLALLCMAANASAVYIQMEAGDDYSFRFSIANTENSRVYQATLENTSSDSTPPLPLIDLLAFNMNATLNEDFTVSNISPAWNFREGARGVQFDYIVERVRPMDRLEPGEELTFDFIFDENYIFSDQPFFDLWLNVDQSLGRGIGGGEDLGQAAVRFQQLGPGGEGSDLVASDWQGNPIPEPGTVLLMGMGLLSVFGLRGGRKFLKGRS